MLLLFRNHIKHSKCCGPASCHAPSLAFLTLLHKATCRSADRSNQRRSGSAVPPSLASTKPFRDQTSSLSYCYHCWWYSSVSVSVSASGERLSLMCSKFSVVWFSVHSPQHYTADHLCFSCSSRLLPRSSRIPAPRCPLVFAPRLPSRRFAPAVSAPTA